MKKIALVVSSLFSFGATCNTQAADALSDCLAAQGKERKAQCFDVLRQKLREMGVAIPEEKSAAVQPEDASRKAEEEKIADLGKRVQEEYDKESSRFGSYERNSFMLKNTRGDDTAIELNVSIRYFLYNGDNVNLFNWGVSPYVFFSYTAKSDFYSMLTKSTRYSAPVISRYQNPAFHFRFENALGNDRYYMRGNDNYGKPRNWLDVGVEHISNGQAFDVNQNVANRATAINAYNTSATDEKSRMLMDSISREQAQVALTMEAQRRLSDISAVKVKWFTKRWGSEEAVFWGPYGSQNVTFKQFQLFRVQYDTDTLWLNEWRERFLSQDISNRMLGAPWHFKAEWNVGSKGLASDSWNFLLRTPFNWGGVSIPWGFSAHRGPMNNLSEYTRNQNTFSTGLDLSF